MSSTRFSPEGAEAVSEIFGRRVREVRTSRGWSQERLVERIGDIGGSITQSTLSRIERPGSGIAIRLDDAILIAWALSVSPLALMTPLEETPRVLVANDRGVSPKWFRHWVNGSHALDDDNELDRAAYYAQVPHRKAELYRQLPTLHTMEGMLWIVTQFLDLTDATKSVGDLDVPDALAPSYEILDHFTESVIAFTGQLKERRKQLGQAATEEMQRDQSSQRGGRK